MKIKVLVINKENPLGVVEEIEDSLDAIKKRVGGEVSMLSPADEPWSMYYRSRPDKGDFFAITSRGTHAYGDVLIVGDRKTDAPGAIPARIYDAPIPLLFRTPEEARAAGFGWAIDDE